MDSLLFSSVSRTTPYCLVQRSRLVLLIVRGDKLPALLLLWRFACVCEEEDDDPYLICIHSMQRPSSRKQDGGLFEFLLRV